MGTKYFKTQERFNHELISISIKNNFKKIKTKIKKNKYEDKIFENKLEDILFEIFDLTTVEDRYANYLIRLISKLLILESNKQIYEKIINNKEIKQFYAIYENNLENFKKNNSKAISNIKQEMINFPFLKLIVIY